MESESIESKQTANNHEIKEATKTIAILPFDDISPQKDQEYFVDGLTEEMLNYITNIPGLQVTSRTSSFAFKNTDKTIQEIAEILKREYILEGSVRKAGNDLRISAQLIHVPDDRHIWSETYDKELKDIFEIQKDIANKVADKLKLTFDALQLGGTDNLKAYEQYLIAVGLISRINVDISIIRRALESADTAISLDSDFALAWVVKSSIHSRLAVYNTPDRAFLEFDAALNAAQRAIEIEPRLGKAYFSLGSLYSAKSEFIKAEKAYRKGMKLTSESNDLSHHYAVIGYLRKSNELVEEMLRNDPLQQELRSVYILNLSLVGDIERAEEEEYKRGKLIFGDQWISGDTMIGMARASTKSANDISDIPEPLRSGVVEGIGGLEDFLSKSPEERLAELHRRYGANNNLSSLGLYMIADMAASLGDPELALNAIKKGGNISGRNLWRIWKPTMKEVRQLPSFKDWVREIGLVDYWKKYGWPDLCHPVGDDDFVCE